MALLLQMKGVDPALRACFTACCSAPSMTAPERGCWPGSVLLTIAPRCLEGEAERRGKKDLGLCRLQALTSHERWCPSRLSRNQRSWGLMISTSAGHRRRPFQPTAMKSFDCFPLISISYIKLSLLTVFSPQIFS